MINKKLLPDYCLQNTSYLLVHHFKYVVENEYYLTQITMNQQFNMKIPPLYDIPSQPTNGPFACFNYF